MMERKGIKVVSSGYVCAEETCKELEKHLKVKTYITVEKCGIKINIRHKYCDYFYTLMLEPYIDNPYERAVELYYHIKNEMINFIIYK